MNRNTLHGTVIHGDRIGRGIGFPTANLHTDDPLPENGIYVALMEWESGNGYGMLYIGNRPTVGGTEKRVEMHLLDFNGELYGQSVSIQIIHFLRKEKKFEQTSALQEQLRADRKQTEEYLALLLKDKNSPCI